MIEVEGRWRRKLGKNKKGKNFGLAKKAEQKQSNESPMKLVNHNEYKSPADIWAY